MAVKNQLAMAAGANGSAPIHPFFPLGVTVPGYSANSTSTPTLLAIFAAGCAVIFTNTYLITKRVQPKLPNGEMATVFWFVLCGFIHFFFEGYFVINFHQIGSLTSTFSQLWKEYSLSDSRYMTQDSFVVCMEGITALFWGPLSFFCAYCIVTGHPFRHWIQSIISLGQLYGDVLYYATCAFEHLVSNLDFCRPEQIYFWAYFVLMNAFWIVIPSILLFQSARETTRAFAKLSELEKKTEKKEN